MTRPARRTAYVASHHGPTNAGSGYSTPSVVGDRLYLLGNEGLDNESVRALGVKDGAQVWATRLGKVGNPQQKPPVPAARSTPTVEGNLLYALGSDGDLACVEITTGKARWRKNLRSDFGGKPGQWAYSESPLIDGESIICTPGGAGHPAPGGAGGVSSLGAGPAPKAGSDLSYFPGSHEP